MLFSPDNQQTVARLSNCHNVEHVYLLFRETPDKAIRAPSAYLLRAKSARTKCRQFEYHV